MRRGDGTDSGERVSWLRILESVLNHAYDAVMITETEPLDEPGPQILYVNPAFERLSGYAPEELLGRSPRILQGEGTERAELDRVREALEEGRPISVELRNYRKDGTEFWVEITMFPVSHRSGMVTHFASVQRDVTHRRETVAELSRALGQRDLLLVELHHRVKNNLQVISSLLALQATEAEPHCRRVLEETQRRIAAMALLHDALHGSPRSGLVALEPYLSRVVESLLESHDVDAEKVETHVRAPGLSIPVDQAMPCGLIVSELVSNALEHGPAQGGAGDSIVVEASRLDDAHLVLLVGNAGSRLLPEVDFPATGTQGLGLVAMFCDQLGGTLELLPGEGADFRLVFPL